jgi:hypothetical protein
MEEETETTDTTLTINEQIRHLRPCMEAREWLHKQKDWQEAWDTCPRGDWLLWLHSRLNPGMPRGDEWHKVYVRIACEAARSVLGSVPAGELRPLAAIELAERFAAGDDVSESDLRAAAAGAADAAAAYAADAHAAGGAAYAAGGAYVAAAAAAGDAYVAGVAYVADSAAAAAANAAIVRKHIPIAPTVGGE